MSHPAPRAALRASLARIERASHMAGLALDHGAGALDISHAIEEVDRAFEAFDRARLALNQAQADALGNWASGQGEANGHAQDAEDVLEEWQAEHPHGVLGPPPQDEPPA